MLNPRAFVSGSMANALAAPLAAEAQPAEKVCWRARAR
jgi:hypothetical protein